MSGLGLIRRKDIKGKVFGKLTVVSFSHRNKHRMAVWNCQCLCGKAIKMTTNALNSKHSKSCGCNKYKDLTSAIFDSTYVIKYRRVGKNGKTIYTCSCICGKISERASDSIQRSAKYVGCSCKKIGRRLPEGMGAFNTIYGNYARGAKDRGYEWGISKSQFSELTKKNCHYCAIEPSNKTNFPGFTSQYTYNGIDRKNNLKGYIKSNCLPCCKRCNLAKGSITYKEFVNWIARFKEL